MRYNRNYSQREALEFENDYFDWVYVDALHTYEGVAQDLASFDTKVKPGGLFVGHDFANSANSRKHHYGVVEAVSEFVARTGYQFMMITNEDYPSFVIAKDPNSPACMDLMEGVMAEVDFVVEVDNFFDLNYEQRQTEAVAAGEATGAGRVHIRLGRR